MKQYKATFDTNRHAKQKAMPAWVDKTEKYRVLVVLVDGHMTELIRVRVKYPRDGACRLCTALWVSPNPFSAFSARGAGTASGYGYHKVSAAISAAFRDAGYTFDHEVSGVGESAIDAAMLAVAALIYQREFVAYGENANAIFV